MRVRHFQRGFTLVEIAIVLLIVTIMLGYTVAMFPIQQELKQYRGANSEMNEIVNHLIAFAQINGRLPCPDTSGGGGTIDGSEDSVDVIINATGATGTDNVIDGCAASFGFLPNRTLGLTGSLNTVGNLLDPWGGVYGYAVSTVDTDSDGDPATAAAIDLVSPNGVREEGLGAVEPDLVVCDDSPALGNHVACQAGTTTIIDNAAVVIISLGKDRGTVASNIQAENQDDFHNGSNDRVFTFTTRSDAAGSEFDDVVKWIPRHLLFSKMIEAGQLP
jgi:prepilin-type N-terminal cleavage/methylation domain-containing protein